MAKVVDRTGERNINTFGSEMVIVECRGALDIDVYFPEYNWIAKGMRYDNFKKGNIKCPYERRVYGVGYLGEGKYKVYENGKNTKYYDAWHDMLNRCYSEKLHKNILHIKIVKYVMNGIIFRTLEYGMRIIIIKLKMKKCI